MRVFHMTDFNSRKGEFAGWSAELCHDFSFEMVRIVREYVEFWIGNTIETASSHLIDDEVAALSPYLVGCAYLLKHVEDWIATRTDPVQIAYVLEDGVKDQHKFDLALKNIFGRDATTAKRFGYVSHTYKQKSLPGLQVADILAWQLHVDGKRYDTDKKRRGDFLNLLEVPHLIGHFDEVALQLIRKGLLGESQPA